MRGNLKGNNVYIIYKEGGTAPTKQYETLQEAKTEAQRLAQINPQFRFYVCEVVASCGYDRFSWRDEGEGNGNKIAFKDLKSGDVFRCVGETYLFIKNGPITYKIKNGKTSYIIDDIDRLVDIIKDDIAQPKPLTFEDLTIDEPFYFADQDIKDTAVYTKLSNDIYRSSKELGASKIHDTKVLVNSAEVVSHG